MAPRSLTREDIDAIADAIAERVAPIPTEGLVRIDTVCRLLDVEKSWVYDHQVELGARKLDGALRFDIATIRRYIADHAVTNGQQVDELDRRRHNGARNRGSRSAAFELLPVPQDAW